MWKFAFFFLQQIAASPGPILFTISSISTLDYARTVLLSIRGEDAKGQFQTGREEPAAAAAFVPSHQHTPPLARTLFLLEEDPAASLRYAPHLAREGISLLTIADLDLGMDRLDALAFFFRCVRQGRLLFLSAGGGQSACRHHHTGTRFA
jgi:hypothetical protein